MFAVAEFWSPDARELDRYTRRLNTPVDVTLLPGPGRSLLTDLNPGGCL